jgi:hypothetical protein
MKALIISADNFEDSELLVPYYTIIAELSVIPACLESFFEEGCWTSRHDRTLSSMRHKLSRYV